MARFRSGHVLAGFFLSLVALSVVPGRIQAHTRTMSYSTWRAVEGGIRVHVRAPWIEFQRSRPELRGLRPEILLVSDGVRRAVIEWLQAGFELQCGANSCPPRSDVRIESVDGAMPSYSWSYEAPDGGATGIEVRAFFQYAPSHLHMARWMGSGRGGDRERVLTADDRRWDFTSRGAAATDESRFVDFLKMGLGHVSTGYDHMAFLLGLLLIGMGPRRVIALVTGFTVGHTLSLAAAALGWVRPGGPAVESLIGFSIAVVAFEVFWRESGDRERPRVALGLFTVWLIGIGAAWLGRSSAFPPVLFGAGFLALGYFALQSRGRQSTAAHWPLVFVFGLIHGLGFASALSEARLPATRLVEALLGFNAGVEAGQILFLLSAAALFRVLQLFFRNQSVPRFALAGGTLSLGVFWFWSRLLR